MRCLRHLEQLTLAIHRGDLGQLLNELLYITGIIQGTPNSAQYQHKTLRLIHLLRHRAPVALRPILEELLFVQTRKGKFAEPDYFNEIINWWLKVVFVAQVREPPASGISF